MTLEPEESERLAGTIYGTIAVAAVLATGGADEVPDAPATVAYAAITAGVFWLAHAWAHTLGHKAAGGGWAFGDHLRRDWPLVEAGVMPLGVVLLALLVGSGDEDAIEIGLWTSVALLAGWGAYAARRDGSSLGLTIVAAAGCGALGLLLILLKALLH